VCDQTRTCLGFSLRFVCHCGAGCVATANEDFPTRLFCHFVGLEYSGPSLAQQIAPRRNDRKKSFPGVGGCCDILTALNCRGCYAACRLSSVRTLVLSPMRPTIERDRHLQLLLLESVGLPLLLARETLWCSAAPNGCVLGKSPPSPRIQCRMFHRSDMRHAYTRRCGPKARGNRSGLCLRRLSGKRSQVRTSSEETMLALANARILD